MTIQLVIDSTTIPIKTINFSDGSSTIKLEIPDGFTGQKYVSITVDQTTSADKYLWEILLVLSAVQRSFYKTVPAMKHILCLPYLPHARADRVFEYGNPHPLDTFLSVVTDRFDEIIITDPHSDYYTNFGNMFTVKEQQYCFIDTVPDFNNGVLISPDKGALSKIYKLQQLLNIRGHEAPVVVAGKKRELTTGRIIETTLPDMTDLTGRTVYIVDDLLDGGGTFIPLAEKLKSVGAKEVHLYVTHGIFAKGLKIFRGKIDKLHVYQTIGTYVTMQDIHNFNDGKEVR